MLKLGEKFVLFEPSSKLSEIFFDNLNHKVCTVRGNGAMGVTAKGLKGNDDIVSFRTNDHGEMQTLALSPDGNVACMQRDSTSVEFFFLDATISSDVVSEVKQPCRQNGAHLIGLQWIADRTIIFVTTLGLELYQLNHRRRTVKFYKSTSLTPSWFTFHKESKLLVCGSGISNNILVPFLTHNGSMQRLPSFEVDFGTSSFRAKLQQSDVAIVTLYGQVYASVMRHSTHMEGLIERLDLYRFAENGSDAPSLAYSLDIHLDGLVGLHVIDNLIVVHHKNTATSKIFDILVPSSKGPEHAHPPLASTIIQIEPSLKETYDVAELSQYPATWVVFVPNFVVDVMDGIFMTLRLDVEEASHLIVDKINLVSFLLNRTGSQQVLLKTLRKLIVHKALRIGQVAAVLQKILPENPSVPSTSSSRDLSKLQLRVERFTPLKINDLNRIVQSVFLEQPDDSVEVDKVYLSSVLLEFFLLVKKSKMQTDNPYLSELLLRTLAEAKEFNKLQQLLQYRVIDDSKFLAYELISLGRVHPPLIQLAIDMFSRRGNVEQIAQVLIDQGHVIEAARCMRDLVKERQYGLKLLEAAWKTDCRQTKFTMFTYLRDVWKVDYLADEQCERFAKEFKGLFDKDEINQAEERFRLARLASVRLGNRASASAPQLEVLDGLIEDDNSSQSNAGSM